MPLPEALRRAAPAPRPQAPGGATAGRGLQRSPTHPALERLASVGFLVVAAVAVAVQLRLTRGFIPHSDEYGWILHFRNLGSGMRHLWGGWFDPLARLAYNTLFATAGIGSYLPFRLMGALGNLTLAVAVYAYARHIGQRWLGVGFALLLLLLGSASWVVLIPLNSMNAIGLAALPAGLVLLDKDRPRADAATCVLLLVAMGFSGPVVLPICAGLASRLLLERPLGWRRLAVPVIPVVAYVAGFLLSPGDAARDLIPVSLLYVLDFNLFQNILRAPLFMSELASAGAAGLLGLGADKGPAIVAALAVGGSVAIPRLPAPARRRALASVVTAVCAWGVIAVGRDHLGDIGAPRYVVMTVVPVLLVALEVAAHARLSVPGRIAVAGLLLFAIVGNVLILQLSAEALTSQSEVERAELSALELAIDRAPPDYRPDGRTGWPLLYVTAGEWRDATARLGSPALPPAELPRASAEARTQADRILRELSGVDARPGVNAGRAACASHSDAVQQVLPPEGVVVEAGSQPVEVRVRRFADGYPQEAGWVLQPGERRAFVPVRDRSAQRWTAEAKGAAFSLCQAAGAPTAPPA